jgi:hypothetical protein
MWTRPSRGRSATDRSPVALGVFSDGQVPSLVHVTTPRPSLMVGALRLCGADRGDVQPLPAM